MDLTPFYNQFRDEVAENVRTITQGLVQLETVGDSLDRRTQIDAIFRAMHTIKGSARLLGLEVVGQVAHTCEHILAAVREDRRTLDRSLTDDLLRGCDAIAELTSAALDGTPTTIDVAEFTAGLGRGRRTTPELTPAEPALPPIVTSAAATSGALRALARQTVRVRVDRLDRLLNLAGELVITQQGEADYQRALEDLTRMLDRQHRALAVLRRDLVAARLTRTQRETIDQLLDTLESTDDQARRLLRVQNDHIVQYRTRSEQLTTDLEQEVMAARLLPISNVFANLPRAVRELATTLGREVILETTGETIELDRKVIEQLSDPLTHLIRNAIDHGIEPPAERVVQGKPRHGTISVAARSFGTYAHITIADDGRGMDPAHLRESALRKGLISADAAMLLNDQDALDLVFAPGFSTAAMITDVSGRGVGMDVVRTNIIELGGQVLLDSAIGRGTTITLVLPLTMVTTRVLLVEVDRAHYGVPASACHGVTWVTPERLESVEGRAMLGGGDSLIPLLRLGDLISGGAPRPINIIKRLPAVLVGPPQRPYALLVDVLHDEKEVVVKPLGPLFERRRAIAGAILAGDGRATLLLNPAVLLQLARGSGAATVARTAPVVRHRLLVADDSFATRELVRTILATAGYDVTTAVDGVDALDKLRAGSYDLLVSDVEMPRLDGFSLTERVRSEFGADGPPVIIMTSLATDEHRRRGLAAGAQAYIVKSQFDQGKLVETIRQLIG